MLAQSFPQVFLSLFAFNSPFSAHLFFHSKKLFQNYSPHQRWTQPRPSILAHLIFFGFNFCSSFDTLSTNHAKSSTAVALCKIAVSTTKISKTTLSYVLVFFRILLVSLRFRLHRHLLGTQVALTAHSSFSIHHQPLTWTELLSRFDRTRRVRITSTLSASNNEQSVRFSNKCRVTYCVDYYDRARL